MTEAIIEYRMAKNHQSELRHVRDFDRMGHQFSSSTEQTASRTGLRYAALILAVLLVGALTIGSDQAASLATSLIALVQ